MICELDGGEGGYFQGGERLPEYVIFIRHL